MARLVLAALLVATFSAAAAPPAVLPAMAPADTPAAAYPRKIPAPGGHGLMPSERTQRSHDELKYAPARRLGDVLCISGVVAGPGFTGDRAEQFKVISAVEDEFMGAPHAAWTAVGTDGLQAPDAVVEIQVIAHATRDRPAE